MSIARINFSSKPVAGIALSVLFIINFLENYMRGLISVSIIPFLNYDSYTYSLLTGTFFAIMYTCGGLIFSLSQNLQSKRVICIAISCFIFSFATFVTALSQSVLLLVVIRMVMGLAQSVVTPFASGIIGSHFTYENRGTYMYDAYGWKAGYFLFGLIGMGVAIVMPVLVSEGPHTGSVINDDDESMSLLPADNAVKALETTVPKVPSNGSFYEIEEEYEDEDFIDISLASDSTISPIKKHFVKKEILLESSSSPPVDTSCSSKNSCCLSIIKTLRNVLRVWRREPLLVAICLATGIRLGAGYIWSSYTAIYFSELYLIEDRSSDCLYSNPSVSSQPMSSTLDLSLLRSSSLLDSLVCGSDFPYCFPEEGECRVLNDYPWHNQGMKHIHLQEYMSWVPLVGSGFGSLVGGHVSDKLSAVFGIRARPLVAAVSSFVSVPFVIMALRSGFPSCFLYFIPSGLTGEMYIGASLAFVADITPPALIVPSVAFFMFIVTIIAGNCPLLVPLMLNDGIEKTYHTFSLNAADYVPGNSTPVEYSVTERSGFDLQKVMTIVISSLYIISSLGYFWIMLRSSRPVGALSRRESQRDDGAEETNAAYKAQRD